MTELSIGPRALYPLKAGLTRLRSVAWRLRGAPVRDEGLRILFYHRVSDERDELAVTPRRFREQMGVLADTGYRVVDVAAGLSHLDDRRTVALSFDDGYADVAENALPELERHGFGATVFVATGVTDGRAAFTWYERQPPLIGWDDIRRLDGGALRFEPHTVTHPDLRTLDEPEVRAELEDSKLELEGHVGRPTEIFCYPAGLFGERERRLAAEAGFRAACSCEPGVNTSESDPFALRRVQIDARDGLLDFRAKLAGGHDAPSRARAVWRHVRYGAK